MTFQCTVDVILRFANIKASYDVSQSMIFKILISTKSILTAFQYMTDIILPHAHAHIKNTYTIVFCSFVT